jgi:hypothetical protein
MAKLKLGPIADDKPVKITVELPAGLHRDLTAYAEILGRETGRRALEWAMQRGSRSGRTAWQFIQSLPAKSFELEISD